jgi:hypothetical protein
LQARPSSQQTTVALKMNVNDVGRAADVDGDTPPLWVLRGGRR